MADDGLRQRFEAAGQGQVFRFWDDLSPAERENLLDQAREIDLEELRRLLGETGGESSRAEIEPAPCLPLPEDRYRDAAWRRARERGESWLRAGKVAAFTVAGGQGTRLGFEGPKGTFPVTPVRGKSLFQVFAEKIRAAERTYGAAVPWLIMTSHANHGETIAFFERNGYFGLSPEAVSFFRQGRMPAVDFDGRIMLETKASIAMSPDGHGGSLRALARSGMLETLRARGIETISYFQVDNPLVRVLDPWFLGFHLERGSEMSSKMVRKADPGERVGVFGVRGGRLEVVEYSDLPPALARATDARGRLRFDAGSIAIHLIDVGFAERLAGGAGGRGGALPFHRARKKVPYVSDNGERVAPPEPNGIKFEMFVFDALPGARNPLVLETSREDEFSPVKNATGPDSAETCVRDQMKQFARWFRAAGVAIAADADGVPGHRIEVSPLFATGVESFRAAWEKLAPRPGIRDGLYLE